MREYDLLKGRVQPSQH